MELGLRLGLRRTEGAVLHVYDKKRCAAFDNWPVAGEGLAMILVLLHLFAGNKPKVPVLG